ncbi:MAG: hypothetical protein NW223_19685 [Hyphomicrobiaceae bacterium]|nr:hypothetical protein [Hyphomicrobiaceae bacterium]
MSLAISLIKAHAAFVLITMVMGGAAAYATGKAVAQTWRPYWQVVLYTLALAAVTRFFHFALFEETLLDAGGYLVEAAVLLLAATAGYRLMRAKQMTGQYDWLFTPSGPFGWRPRP